ncbi:MAG: helix-turn-helix domain-containing protein [Sphingobacteriales bacterium]|nr:MAG: helix-turn-helix domain-containing protein [Sphingobacteriales bacterium]
MKKVKNTIPVYDICTLNSSDHYNSPVIAEHFDKYLEAHPKLHLPHRHSFYHLVLFTKGGGFHTIDFEQFDVKAGQIYFMAPGQVHSWNFKGKTDGYVINFPEDVFDNFLSNKYYLEAFPFLQGIANEGVIDLDKTTSPEARNIFETLVENTHTQPTQALDMIRVSLIRLFILVNRSITIKDTNTARPHNQLLLHNFRKLVDIHFAEKRLPKEYASLLYITPNYLNALCNDLIGESAGETIRKRILLEAKRLLINANYSISEIALQLNFTDNSHFTRFFKKYTNTTPEEFRRSSLAHN